MEAYTFPLQIHEVCDRVKMSNLGQISDDWRLKFKEF